MAEEDIEVDSATSSSSATDAAAGFSQQVNNLQEEDTSPLNSHSLEFSFNTYLKHFGFFFFF